MKIPAKEAALIAFRLAVRPFVRLMLRSGIAWKQAADVLKQSFVEVAEQDYGLHGRVANASRVAILTGLNRRVVKQIRESLATGAEPILQRMNSATRLLGGWHTDPDFKSATGQPAGLSIDDPEGFAKLCRRYAPDIPPTAMLKELIRVRAAMQSDDGTLVPLMRYYMPDPLDSDAILRAGDVIADLANTLEYNLQPDRPVDSRTRFEGRAWNGDIPLSAEPLFRAFLEAEAQAMLERADAWLAQHEQDKKASRRTRRLRLGVGIYQIQESFKR